MPLEANFFNVKNYPSIGSAFNAATAAGGGIVYFPAGTFTVTSQNVPTNVSIICAGPTATIINAGSPTADIFDVSGSNVTITECGFGPSGNAGSSQTAGAYINITGDNVVVSNFVMNGPYVGILLNDSIAHINTGTFSNITMASVAPGSAAVVCASAGDSHISNITVEPNNFGANNWPSYGVQVTGNLNTGAGGCALTLNGANISDTNVGIALTPPANSVSYIKATNVQLISGWSGVLIQPVSVSGTVGLAEIENMQVITELTGGNGILIDQQTYGGNITGVKIADSNFVTMVPGTGSGVLMQGQISDALFANNVIGASGEAYFNGFVAQSGAGNYSLVGNSIFSSAGTSVYTSGNGNEYIITGNWLNGGNLNDGASGTEKIVYNNTNSGGPASLSPATTSVTSPTIAVNVSGKTTYNVANYNNVADAFSAASASGGGIVYFPQGTYKIKNQVVPSDTIVMCSGMGSTILEPASATADVFDVTGSNATIYNCGFQSRGAVGTSQTAGAFINITGSGVTVTNFMMNGPYVGILLNGGEIEIGNGTFYGVTQQTVAPGSAAIVCAGATNGIITDVTLGASGFPQSEWPSYGIEVTASSNSGCSLSVTDSGFLNVAIGMSVTPSSGQVANVAAANIWFDSEGWLGVLLQPAGTIGSAQFTNVWTAPVGGAGGFMLDQVTGNGSIGPVVINNSQAGEYVAGAGTGIELSGYMNAVSVVNTEIQSFYNGLVVTNGAGNLWFLGNSIFAASGSGLWTSGAASNNIIDFNRFNGSAINNVANDTFGGNL